MNPRTTGLLFVAVAVLGAFVWFYEVRGGAERAEAEAEARRLFPGLEADAIQAVTLETADGRSARVERLAEGGWRIREPRDFPADTTAMNALVSALASMESDAVFEEPAALEDYGLGDEPTLRFETGAGAEPEQVLRIGDKTPVGSNTYVATAADAPVYAVASFRVNALAKRFEELQDKRVLAFDPTTVTGLVIRWHGNGVELLRDGDEWQLVRPVEERADTRTVEDLLSQLSFLRASGFLADPPSDAELGLEDPEFQVEITLGAGGGEKDGEPTQLLVAVGGNLDGENRAVRGREETLRYAIPADRLDDWPRRVGAYRFKEMARFDVRDAKRLEIVFQDPGASQSVVVTAIRGEDGWTAEPEPMDPARVASLVAALSRLRAQDVVASGLGPAGLMGLGLSPPRVRLRVFGELPGDGSGDESDVEPLGDVQLGLALPGKGIAASRPDSENLYWIEYDLAEEIPVSLQALRNRFLVADGGEAPDPGEAAVPPFPGGDFPIPLDE